MFVIPKPGLKIRNPRTRLHLPPGGAEVFDVDASYWQRRIADGDVTLQKPVSQPRPTRSAPATKRT